MYLGGGSSIVVMVVSGAGVQAVVFTTDGTKVAEFAGELGGSNESCRDMGGRYSSWMR